MNVSRAIIITLLALIAWMLLQLMPLIPKISRFFDDIHHIRTEAEPQWREIGTGIHSSLNSIRERFRFFQEEEERRRSPPHALPRR